jgi:catechol 2,3-dioxygenase-like lactoylglutathione lyase family enzyme
MIHIQKRSMKMEVNYIQAQFAVSDLQRSRRFYEEILHQEIKYDFGSKLIFEGRFSLQLEPDFAGQTGTHIAGLYFESDDLDAVLEELKNNYIEIIHPPLEQPWRQRVLRVCDPDGYVIEIGDTVEIMILRLHHDGLSVQEIAAQTQISPEVIAGIIM